MIPVLLLFALMQQPGFEVEPIHKLCDDGKYYLRVTPGTPPVYEEAPCLVMPTSATITIVSPPEPIDVPAIPHDWNKDFEQCINERKNWGWHSDAYSAFCTLWAKSWTCADKTRILQHDEQTPPKYWCHKVQP